MKFYADENIPKQFVVGLRALGHDVIYAVEATRSLCDLTILRETFKEDTLIIPRTRTIGGMSWSRNSQPWAWSGCA